ncbi:DUF3530 family protein [Candidatus Thiothrix anitrata]|uniref:DUF3530 family protein n=1 Tax=Candidatus Thiothrix anitrata TaxID=2823902 RepID=A0ABX7X6C7_9GAMM|nr:DUF3530 family protein [Candidatus Thiothrix anitrata]QTR51430.1 DUF3530 family protein [Candidatus Thiothrix anitrata]
MRKLYENCSRRLHSSLSGSFSLDGDAPASPNQQYSSCRHASCHSLLQQSIQPLPPSLTPGNSGNNRVCDTRDKQQTCSDANAAPDYAREQRLASEISDAIMDGDVISLNDGAQNFMGILTTAEQPRGAVIILHGRGYHPDWEDVANPLRTGLAAKGWTTLSLQMPVLEKEAKYYDYVPLFANADKRIDAGIAFLKQKGINNIALAAHSCGAHMAMNWISTKGDNNIAAYVGLRNGSN